MNILTPKKSINQSTIIGRCAIMPVLILRIVGRKKDTILVNGRKAFRISYCALPAQEYSGGCIIGVSCSAGWRPGEVGRAVRQRDALRRLYARRNRWTCCLSSVAAMCWSGHSSASALYGESDLVVAAKFVSCRPTGWVVARGCAGETLAPA